MYPDPPTPDEALNAMQRHHAYLAELSARPLVRVRLASIEAREAEADRHYNARRMSADVYRARLARLQAERARVLLDAQETDRECRRDAARRATTPATA
jgi:hypothetical protein